jgi:hypothetical protein
MQTKKKLNIADFIFRKASDYGIESMMNEEDTELQITKDKNYVILKI